MERSEEDDNGGLSLKVESQELKIGKSKSVRDRVFFDFSFTPYLPPKPEYKKKFIQKTAVFQPDVTSVLLFVICVHTAQYVLYTPLLQDKFDIKL